MIDGSVAGQEGNLDWEFRKGLSEDLGPRSEYWEGATPASNLKRHFPQRRQHDKDLETEKSGECETQKEGQRGWSSKRKGESGTRLCWRGSKGQVMKQMVCECLEEKTRITRSQHIAWRTNCQGLYTIKSSSLKRKMKIPFKCKPFSLHLATYLYT